MLHFLRRNKQSTWVKVALGSIIAVFVLWGVGSFVSSQNSLTAVATVDGKDIEQRTVVRAYRNMLQAYRDAYKGQFSAEMAKSLNLKQRALDQLVDRQLLSNQADVLGLRVADQELRDALLSETVFQVDGRFNKDAYLRTLRYAGMTPADYENDRRRDLAIKRLQSLIESGIRVGDADVRDEIVNAGEKAELSFVKFRASEQTTKVEVKEEDLAKHFDAKKEVYREPERAYIELIAYPSSKFEQGVAVSDEEIKDYYDLHESDKFSQQKEVRARHILIKTKADADAKVKAEARKKIEDLASKAKAGEDFGALAIKFSEDEASAKKGGDLGFFGEGKMVKPFEEAAFGMEVGAISDVIESPFGFHVLKVEEVKEARTKPLEEVRAEIESTLKSERAEEAAKDAAEEDKPKIASSGDMDEIAKARGLTVDRPPALTKNDSIPGLGRNGGLLAAAFALEPGGTPEPAQIGSTWTVVRLKEKVPSVIPELSKVQEKVETAYRLEKGTELAKQAAEQFLEAVKAAGSLDAAAKKAEREVEMTGSFGRGGAYLPKIGSSPPLKEEAFRLSTESPLGSQVFVSAGDAFVVSLKAKTQPTDEEITKQIDSIRKSLIERRQQSAFEEYLKQLKQKAEIRLDPAKLDQIPTA